MPSEACVFHKFLTNGEHVHQFVIDSLGRDGWTVREQHDQQVVREKRYRDWHRVERARDLFVWKTTQLSDSGWTES